MAVVLAACGGDSAEEQRAESVVVSVPEKAAVRINGWGGDASERRADLGDPGAPPRLLTRYIEPG